MNIEMKNENGRRVYKKNNLHFKICLLSFVCGINFSIVVYLTLKLFGI